MRVYMRTGMLITLRAKDWEGRIETEVIDNTNIIFGNERSSDVQSQPYIIIVQQRLTDEVKEEAESQWPEC